MVTNLSSSASYRICSVSFLSLDISCGDKEINRPSHLMPGASSLDSKRGGNGESATLTFSLPFLSLSPTLLSISPLNPKRREETGEERGGCV